MKRKELNKGEEEMIAGGEHLIHLENIADAQLKHGIDGVKLVGFAFKKVIKALEALSEIYKMEKSKTNIYTQIKFFVPFDGSSSKNGIDITVKYYFWSHKMSVEII